MRRQMHSCAACLVLVAVAGSGAMPSAATAAGLRACKPIRVPYGIIGVAAVSQRNTSCQFARYFVRTSRLCSSDESRVKGWRKTFSTPGEGAVLTLRKGSKTIRTNACAT